AAAVDQLRTAGLAITNPAEWNESQRHFLHGYFTKEVLPVLTPLAVQELRPPPHLAGLQWHLAVLLKNHAGEGKIAVTPLPQQVSRWVRLPSEETLIARLDHVMAAHAGLVFPGSEILATALFRVTRDADIAVERDDTDDMLEAVERAVLTRQRRP